MKRISALLLLWVVMVPLAALGQNEPLGDLAKRVRKTSEVTDREVGAKFSAPTDWTWHIALLPTPTLYSRCAGDDSLACMLTVHSHPLPPGRETITEAEARAWEPEAFAKSNEVLSSRAVQFGRYSGYEVVVDRPSIGKARYDFVAAADVGRMFQFSFTANTFMSDQFAPRQPAVEGLLRSFSTLPDAKFIDFSSVEEEAYALIVGLAFAEDALLELKGNYLPWEELVRNDKTGKSGLDDKDSAVLRSRYDLGGRIQGKSILLFARPKTKDLAAFSWDGTQFYCEHPKVGGRRSLGNLADVVAATLRQ